MSNIIHFPSKVDSDWLCFEQGLITILSKIDVSESFQIYIISRMKQVFKDYDFSFELTLNVPREYLDDITVEIVEVNKALQKRTHLLLLSRLDLEIELAKSQGIYT